MSQIGLEYIINEFKMKNTEVADVLGVSRKLITEWVKGRRNITDKNLEKLSEYFNLPKEYFTKQLKINEKYNVQFEFINKQIKEKPEQAKDLSGEIELLATQMEATRDHNINHKKLDEILLKVIMKDMEIVKKYEGKQVPLEKADGEEKKYISRVYKFLKLLEEDDIEKINKIDQLLKDLI